MLREGITAVVTGGGRGIGAAVARALSAGGASVAVCARSGREVAEFAAQLVSEGSSAFGIECDVTDPDSVEAMAEAAIRHLERIDVLVNNAGAAESAPFSRLTLDHWDRMLAVNATGAFLCTRACLPGMRERGFGRVVNVASVAGLAGAPYIAAYAASKHALIGLTRSVAAEVAREGVTVNAVCPGYVNTDMTDGTLERVREKTGKTREEALKSVLATTGQPRLIEPEEVAHTVVSLCHEQSGGINGQAIVLDGGGLLA